MFRNDSGSRKIGVFIDGNFFIQVNSFYAFHHKCRNRINVRGLFDFIERTISEKENTPLERTKIVESHFFRMRVSANEAQNRGNLLYYDRVLEDVLSWQAITTHFLPMKFGTNKNEVKPIDVAIALEAYEQATLKELDVVVLIASDVTFTPLVRKLNTLGARVMLLTWAFEYTDRDGMNFSQGLWPELLKECSYPMLMHELIDAGLEENDPKIKSLFVRTNATSKFDDAKFDDAELNGDQLESEVFLLKNNYGFIRHQPANLFFHQSDLVETSFDDIQIGDPVQFSIGLNSNGDEVAKNVRIVI
ncbi:MAG: NYN domain-containing protein [Ignavibacteria bacterium]|nr:NYN domain-containing protein [Ignavibacteria bacterium]